MYTEQEERGQGEYHLPNEQGVQLRGVSSWERAIERKRYNGITLENCLGVAEYTIGGRVKVHKATNVHITKEEGQYALHILQNGELKKLELPKVAPKREITIGQVGGHVAYQVHFYENKNGIPKVFAVLEKSPGDLVRAYAIKK